MGTTPGISLVLSIGIFLDLRFLVLEVLVLVLQKYWSRVKDPEFPSVAWNWLGFSPRSTVEYFCNLPEGVGIVAP